MQSAVAQILDESRGNEALLASRLDTLAAEAGEATYQEVLLQLVGKRFPVSLAALYWREALARRANRCQEGCAYTGVRSSLLGYLYQVAGEIRDPRIIEADDLAGYQHASVTDGLTGLYYQTYFKAHLEQLTERLSGHHGQGLAVVMLDLDHFKQYNDRCGHLAGDRALQQVADAIQACIRQGDIAARYGGEEFSLILHRLNLPQACMVTERIRQTVEEINFAGQERLDSRCLTISAGIAVHPDDGDTAEKLLQRADAWLYQAKQRRNAVFPHDRDQRRARRHPLQSVVEYSVDSEPAFRPGLSRDLSATGLTLACDAAPPLGSALQLRFQQPFWPVACQTTAVVRNTGPSRDGLLTRVGLQFTDSTNALNELLPRQA